MEAQEKYSPIRHLASIMWPPWMDRSEAIFVMLTFAFDAAGDKSQPMLTVAGFASSAEAWDDFSVAWKARLEQDGIEYFHATDLESFRGPFKHWRERSDKLELRRKLSADLMGILQRNVFHKFACTVINKDFEQMSEELKEEFLLNAYSLGGRTCEKLARQWTLHDWKGSPEKKIAIVFESGDEGHGKLQQTLVKKAGRIPPSFRPNRDVRCLDGHVEPGFLPLQAADWLAYEVNWASKKFYGGKLESYSQLRWPMQRFEQYPLGPMGIYTPENQEMEEAFELQKKLIEWADSIGLSKVPKTHGTLES